MVLKFVKWRGLKSQGPLYCTCIITLNSEVLIFTGEEAEKFEEYQDEKERVSPVCQVWLPSGDILFGCAGGQLVKVGKRSNCKYQLASEIYIKLKHLFLNAAYHGL